MADEVEALSDERYDQQEELSAMNAPGALERIEERNKAIAERLTPKRETAPSDVPYVTWIPSEERAGLGMQMGIRMEEYSAGIDGFQSRYMRFVFDEMMMESARAIYLEADAKALDAYRDALPLPSPSVPAGFIRELFGWLLPVRRPAFDSRRYAAAYRALKEARQENGVIWQKAVVASTISATTAGEPDIQSLDPRTDFYKLMSSHKGMRAAQLVELGKMGRTEKKVPKRSFFGFGGPR